jgi:phosphatidylglycerophosphate synthase
MNLRGLFTFNRRISSRLSPILAKTPLTPNHVTTLALFFGLITGLLFSRGTRLSMIGGALALQICYVLDNCDGDIARIKNMRSRFGMWYDFVVDLLADFALWTGAAWGAAAQGVSPVVCVVGAVIAYLGSLIHFFRTVTERLRMSDPSSKNFETRQKDSFGLTMHSLAHDGDPSLLVWILAIVGYPGYFLLLGCLYIHFVWIYSFWNEKRILA